MMLAKDLKRIVNQLPDDCAVIVGANYNCDIRSFTYRTLDNIAELHLTDGYEIVADKFVDGLFKDLRYYAQRAGRMGDGK